jgi:hypothetical protein
MNSKVSRSAGIVPFATAAGLLLACGQAADPGPTQGSESTTDALNTVIGCQTQAFACAADAQGPLAGSSCDSGFRACLASLLPDAGALPKLPLFDGGFPPVPTPPAFDAGLPIRTFDAGLPIRPFDAGLPTPPPIVVPDGGAPSEQACLVDLQTCLTTTPDVATCATQVRTCLTAVDQSRCDAQEAACIATGAPKVLCDAQRAACP